MVSSSFKIKYPFKQLNLNMYNIVYVVYFSKKISFASFYLGHHCSLYSSSSVYVTAIVSFVLVWFLASSGCSVWLSLVLLY